MKKDKAHNTQTTINSIRFFPTKPGVYIMKNRDDTVIYVGKAKNLRNRVRSYFSRDTSIKTTVLMSHVDTIETIVTRNEYEALLLEISLIKEHTPRYNINLKDGKSYPVIRVTREEYPRVFKTRTIIDDGSEYFGPFTSVESIDTYLEIIERLFPIRKCRGPLRHRTGPCLYYHIGRCSAPCAGKIDKTGYNANIESIKQLLRGNTGDLKKEITSLMNTAAENLRFENAGKHRDTLKAIETLEQEQQVIDNDPEVRDYIAYAVQDELCSFVVFQMRSGRLLGTDVFHTPVFSDEENDLQVFIMRYYEDGRPVPNTIYLNSVIDTTGLSAYIEETRGTTVLFTVPDTPRDRSILRMAEENARQDLSKRIREHGNLPALEELTAVLSLKRTPLRIEGFDIAQLSGKHTVASMVSFQNGIPDKNNYRRYHITSTDGRIDDFQSMREVVARRYTRVINEKLPRADLILIDGGIGQVNAAAEILRSLGLENIPVIGLAKKNEEIFLPGNPSPVVLPEGSPPLRVLQYVRDEAHRFATSFNQNLRTHDIGFTRLTAIPGIGEKRSRLLLESFGSVQAIRDTPPEVIAETCRIPRKTVKAVQTALAEETGDAPPLSTTE
jgi:excinuclease ABC subunit C